jgi:Xaa-Pro aminopeptidase
MVTSNEPGYYADGRFGVRIESVMVCREAQTPHRFGGTRCEGGREGGREGMTCGVACSTLAFYSGQPGNGGLRG